MLEPELLPPKITKLFLEHKHNSMFIMLCEILILTLVCVYVLLVFQRGSTKRFLWDFIFNSPWAASSREDLLVKEELLGWT